jgi:hypothetical protein
VDGRDKPGHDALTKDRSDLAIHLTAAIFGEADALLSMIASRPPEAASQRLVID